jgi:multidrug efflux pump subunit AcrA (membrane-fusion protein)
MPPARTGKPGGTERRGTRRGIPLLYILPAALLLILPLIFLFQHFDPLAQPPLPTEPVTRGTFINTIDVNGSLQPKDQAVVTTALPGPISAIWVAEGDMVSEGQELFEVEVASTGWGTSYQNVTAPISGQVVKLDLAVGRSFAEQSSAASPGLVIADLESMEAVLDVNEVDVPHIAVGQTAELGFDAIAGLTLNATIAHIATLPNEGAAAQGLAPGGTVVTYPVRLVLDESDPRLKPGMSVSARVTVAEIPDVLLVTALALQELDGTTVVYVQDTNGDRVAVEVTVIASSPTQAAIEGELAEGERVLMDAYDAQQEGRSDLFTVRSRFNG